MQKTPNYAKDADLCKIHQSMQKTPIYAKYTNLCKRCRSMQKRPIYVKKPGPWAMTGKN